jgi:hypothetical protein
LIGKHVLASNNSAVGFQVVVESILILISEGSQVAPATLQIFADGDQAAPHSNASKLIVIYCNSKISLHFHDDCGTFCEGDRENANKGNEVIVQQQSNLPSLLSLASATSTLAALDASALSDTLAEAASLISLFLVGQNDLNDHIGLVNLSDLGNDFVDHIGLVGLNDLVCFINHNGLGLIGPVGCTGPIRLIGDIGFGLISLVGLSGFGLVGLSGINGLIVRIGLAGFVGLSGFGLISLVGIIGFGLVGLSGINGLIGRISLVNRLQFEIEMKPSQQDLFWRESGLWCVWRVFSSLAGLDSVFLNAL